MSVSTPKIFGQSKPADTVTPSVLYTVSTNTSAQVTLFVCNQSSDVEFFQIALVPAGGTLTPPTGQIRYLAYDSPLAGNGVFSVSGIGVTQGDSIYVKSAYGNLSFTATGIQLS